MDKSKLQVYCFEGNICRHNLCFKQNLEKYFFLSENYHFTVVKNNVMLFFEVFGTRHQKILFKQV